MGKGRFFGSLALLIALVAVGSSGGGCGRANDQGISFRALGFFAAGDGSLTDSGANVSLTNDFQVPVDRDCDQKITESDGGILGLENNLIQGINLDHVDLTYRVPGSGIAVPPSAFSLAARLGPSSGQEPNNPPIVFRRIVIAPTSTLQFLNANRGSLPPTPFDFIADATAVGIADSGDDFRTNRISYHMTMFEGLRSCETPTPEPTAVPTGVPAPKGKGEHCAAGSECASGACSQTLGCLGAVGDPCNASNECVSPSVCTNGSCAAPTPTPK